MTATIHAARVVRVDPGGPIVRVPTLAAAAEWGPVPTLVGGLTAGEPVAVTNLGSSRDQLLILGRMFGRVPGIGDIEGLQQNLETITEQVGGLEEGQEGVFTVLEQHGEHLDDIDAGQLAQNGRLTSLETRTGTVESVNTTQNTRLTALEAIGTRRPTGTIEPTLRTIAETGTLFLQGQEVSRSTYSGLWTFVQQQGLIGRGFGGGNGSTTFVLPDMRGRAVVGADAAQTLGSLFGADSLVLGLAQMPIHDHGAMGEHDHSHSLTVTAGGQHNHSMEKPRYHRDPTYAFPHDHQGGPGTVAEGPGPEGVRGAAGAAIWTNQGGSHGHGVTGGLGLNGLHTHHPAGGTNPVDVRQRSIAINWIIYT